jgi:hypothetical protein
MFIDLYEKKEAHNARPYGGTIRTSPEHDASGQLTSRPYAIDRSNQINTETKINTPPSIERSGHTHTPSERVCTHTHAVA